MDLSGKLSPEKLAQDKLSSLSSKDALLERISDLIRPLGYEVVALDWITQRQKTLRVYIDFLPSEAAPSASESEARSIGIEDCVKVTRALDEPLDAMKELEAAFKGPYELEVSSPGVDRPLRKASDFERFAGKEAKVHVFRPLTAEELGNPGYQTRNPKQKNFLGTLRGFKDGKACLEMSIGGKTEAITIPLPLISKANLEPRFEFDEND